jgi:hypothetical protein
MKNSQKAVNELALNDQLMIKDIIVGYFQCRRFFSQNQDNQNNLQLQSKKKLLKNLSSNFFDKYYFHPRLMKDDYNKEVLKKQSKVFLKYKDASFIYPYSFTRFMDRLQDKNIIPIREIDLGILDSFMNRFSKKSNLESFFAGFFLVVKSLLIPLRERDVELLRLLTNAQFLLEDKDGSVRIHVPEIEEILQVLGYGKKQYLRIKRSLKFLYRFRICFINAVIMNPAKFGFFYAKIEYSKANIYVQSLRKFILCDFPFDGHRLAIVCVPYGNASELLDNKSLKVLKITNWFWKNDFESYTHKKDIVDGWSNFQIPDFLAKNTIIDNFVHWNLEKSYKDEFNINEIEILKNLSKVYGLSVESLAQLSKNLSSGGVRRILEKFVENGVYQLYPCVAHLGIKDIIFIKITCKNEEYFESLVNNLLSFPESHVFTNNHEKTIYSYFRVPEKLIIQISDKFNLLRYLLEDKIDLKYELAPPDIIIRKFIDLSDLKFGVHNGIANLNE